MKILIVYTLLWESLLQENNKIISPLCRKVFSGVIPMNHNYKFPFIILFYFILWEKQDVR